MAATFGIEEEYVLLDPITLRPVPLGLDAIRDLGAATDGGLVDKEFFPSQVEFSTPICRTSADALDAVCGFRRRLAGWATDAGVLAAASGTPFDLAADAALTPDDRYARIGADIGALVQDHQINGLHVHIGIADREDRVRASNALRPWIPVLLALSANSPFWRGRDTGFASWRAVHSRRWTTYGVPPRFRDAAHHDETVSALRGIGATSDSATINWNVRLPTAYPTLEVRVCDAQLDAWSSIGLAVLIRALTDVATKERVDDAEHTLTDAALWHASRHGTEATLVDPSSGRLAPAPQVLRGLYRRIIPHIHDPIDRASVADLIIQATAGRTGADAQRRAFAAGPVALAELYRSRLVELPASAPPVAAPVGA
ncbi:YbdK family carboxylate-amine ligase [Microbacterium sp. NPDC055910]|uniref:carboxylate-amine ligase n=1 Tax=Microbacterium sp. NPDC055910 TaxID=3345659 RepID=UPI0035D89094